MKERLRMRESESDQVRMRETVKYDWTLKFKYISKI